MIIGVVGLIGSGKDACGGFLRADGWKRLSFGDHVRALAYKINPWIPEYNAPLRNLVISRGWDEIKRDAMSVREFLQNLGNECREMFGEDVWVLKVRAEIDEIDGDIVITDCRYPNEIEMVRSYGGKVVWVERDGVLPLNDHISEKLDFAEYSDFKVRNDGTLDELEEEFMDVVNKILVEAEDAIEEVEPGRGQQDHIDAKQGAKL